MIVILVGKTCSGKTTIESLLVESGFRRVVSCTTRAPRVGEIDGVHYNFVSQQEFEELVVQKRLVEWKRFDGQLYGTLKSDEWGGKWEKDGTAHVVVMEPVGAVALRNHCIANGIPYAMVFVECSAEQISKRFISRVMSGASVDSSARRLQTMLQDEVSWPPSYLIPDITLNSSENAPSKLADQLVNQLSSIRRHCVHSA